MGVFLSGHRLPVEPAGLPHVRGGVSQTVGFQNSAGTSSPRTWGCFCSPTSRWLKPRVFPTYVGVFLGYPAPPDPEKGLPHVRGGVSVYSLTSSHVLKSSPRTWGCFCLRLLCSLNPRVFPTYVGVFPTSQTFSCGCSRLPHVRGGVSLDVSVRPGMVVSSPRTWGCFLAQVQKTPLTVVFPTYVGVFPRCPS